jgi:inner membrane protein
MALAALPDIDVIGFRFGIQYEDLLGHRGLSHSLAVAAAAGGLAIWTWWRQGAGPMPARIVWVYLAVAIASHGLLDMLTDGGLGIALGAPVDNTRYFFPFRPIAVAPIGLRGLLSPGMGRVIITELVWVWAPAAVVGFLGLALQRSGRARTVV